MSMEMISTEYPTILSKRLFLFLRYLTKISRIICSNLTIETPKECWNLSIVNYNDTRMTWLTWLWCIYCKLWTDFTHCSCISIVDSVIWFYQGKRLLKVNYIYAMKFVKRNCQYLRYSSSYSLTPSISRVLIGPLLTFCSRRHQHAVTRLQNVRQLNIRRGKKLGLELPQRQPSNNYSCQCYLQKN